MNYLLYFIIILIIIILLQQHLQNIKPYQNNNALPKNNKKSKTSNKNSNSVNKSNAIEQFQSSTDNNKNIKIGNIRNTSSTSRKINHFSVPEDINNVHSIQLTGKWRDQGHGNRKGRLYLFFINRETNDTTEVLVRDVKRLPLASHSNVDINFTIYNDKSFTYSDDSPREVNPTLPLLKDNNYSVKLRYIVGGGGGHRLYVENINLNIVGNYKQENTYYQPSQTKLEMIKKNYKIRNNIDNDSENNSSNKNTSDFNSENLLQIQYNQPITISFWADLVSLSETIGATNIMSYKNSNNTNGWELNMLDDTTIEFNLIKDGLLILKNPIQFRTNLFSNRVNTAGFIHYTFSISGYQYESENNYSMKIINIQSSLNKPQSSDKVKLADMEFIGADTPTKNTINNFKPSYINYSSDTFTFKLFETGYVDNIGITNQFFNAQNYEMISKLRKEIKFYPYEKKKEDEKIVYENDYDRAKPFINKIHNFGKISGPIDVSLKALKKQFQKDFEYTNDETEFKKDLTTTLKGYIDGVKQAKREKEDKLSNESKSTYQDKIDQLNKDTDLLENEILTSVNKSKDPFQDKTIKSNSYGTILNHLDNLGGGSYLVRNNDNPNQCFYTSSYKDIPNNDTIKCNENDLAQKVNIFNIYQEADYIQHLPKINNTGELHSISNHKEFKYPFNIVKSKNNNKCLDSYDIGKFKFSECRPVVGQQYKIWHKEN